MPRVCSAICLFAKLREMKGLADSFQTDAEAFEETEFASKKYTKDPREALEFEEDSEDEEELADAELEVT